jgi:hypothetical protein
LSAEWWRAHRPTGIAIECSGEKHTLRWENGDLHTLDHGDPEGERVLASLGGERCACVEILDRWEKHRADLRVLTLASRGARDLILPTSAQAQRVRRTALARGGRRVQAVAAPQLQRPSGWVGVGPPLHRVVSSHGGTTISSLVAAAKPWPTSELDSYDPLISVLSLGGGLPDRLVATVLATWSEKVADGDYGDHRPELCIALFSRAKLAIQDWLGDGTASVVVEMIEPSATPGVRREEDLLVASLPFKWLSDIWARGVSMVLGRFAISLLERSDERERVLTLGADLSDPKPVTINIDT